MKSRSLVLLSGEGTAVPAAEARALFLAYDPDSKFESPEPRVLLTESSADPFLVGSRIAFARRVGLFIEDSLGAAAVVHGKRVRFRCFDLGSGRRGPDPEDYLKGIDASVDLHNPDYELTLVRGKKDYLAVTSPATMNQGWSLRRPRSRAFFHPSAIFPKLSRALVNLSRCRKGDVFLDPFAGTGSILIEAYLVGARVVATDLAEKMARGALANMKGLRQDWLGVIRADCAALPLSSVDAIAADVPYGRASSTGGRRTRDIIDEALSSLGAILSKGSLLVLMHPQQMRVEDNSWLRVEEEYDLHVHKLLTRTITVLRR